MSLSSRIRTVLTSNSPLVALVSTRVYAIEAPQGTLMPHIVWEKISTEPLGSMLEQNSEAVSFNRVQFTVFASTFEEVEAVGAALIAAVDNTSVLTGHPGNFEDERDLSSDSPSIYARAIDFSL